MQKFSVFLFFLLSLVTFGILLFYFKKTSVTFSSIKLEKLQDKKNIVPISIIGSGPAGLSAALYAARSGIYTLVFEGNKPGGQLTETTYVENWPGTKKMLGSELIEQNKKQAETFGALMVQDAIEYVDFTEWPFRIRTQEGHEIFTMAAIIATGSTPQTLDIPGEKEYWGYGVTTCAICDAPFYKDKNVVVVGGGDSAIEEATLLASYAKKVTILVRSDKMRAAPPMQERIKNYPNINVEFNKSITKILGNKTSVKQIEVRNNKTKEIEVINIDGVFLAIGHEPNSEIFKKFLPTDSHGYLKLDSRTQETIIPGIFVAGDVADSRYRQAGTAAGFGIMAGLDGVFFLQKIGFNDSFSKKISKNYYNPYKEKKIELKKIKTIEEFKKFIKEPKPLLIDVGAKYCPSCNVLLSVVQSVATQFEDKINFVYIDLEDNPVELQKQLDIKTIPTILIFKNGKLESRFDNQVFTINELSGILHKLLS